MIKYHKSRPKKTVEVEEENGGFCLVRRREHKVCRITCLSPSFSSSPQLVSSFYTVPTNEYNVKVFKKIKFELKKNKKKRRPH